MIGWLKRIVDAGLRRELAEALADAEALRADNERLRDLLACVTDAIDRSGFADEIKLFDRWAIASARRETERPPRPERRGLRLSH